MTLEIQAKYVLLQNEFYGKILDTKFERWVLLESVEIEINYNINLNVYDVQRVIDIQHQVIYGKADTYIIIFSDAKFLNAAVSVLIGTLPVYAQLKGKHVYIRFRDKQSPVFEFIKKVGMYDFFTNSNEKPQYTKQRALPFNRIVNEDMMEEYTDKIMELAPIIMNDKASDVLSSYFFEIYQNSFSHSESEIDVFSCGYWMEKQLIFSIYDMGVGIPYNVQHNIDCDMTSQECIEWAFQEGTTTLDETIIKRGLGLSRLEKFIMLNDGTMSLYSHDICYTITNGMKKNMELNKPIKGTMIIISIKADTEHMYIVDDEKDD